MFLRVVYHLSPRFVNLGDVIFPRFVNLASIVFPRFVKFPILPDRCLAFFRKSRRLDFLRHEIKLTHVIQIRVCKPTSKPWRTRREAPCPSDGNTQATPAQRRILYHIHAIPFGMVTAANHNCVKSVAPTLSDPIISRIDRVETRIRAAARPRHKCRCCINAAVSISFDPLAPRDKADVQSI